MLDMLCLGLNHRSAPVSIREKFSVPRTALAEAGAKLREIPFVDECVLLSTCNRVEVYFWSKQPRESAHLILHYFLGSAADRVDLESHFYLKHGENALRHLCRVVSGLDSMVVGETEIFGQVKDAYRTALEARLTSGRSNRIFQRAFTLGKYVRSNSRITVGPTSVGAASVQMAENILGNLSGAGVLIVGAGDVSRVTAQALKSRGAESIFVANRSFDRALELAQSIGGKAIRFDEWIPFLETIDIVIVSTAAPHYIITPSLIQPIQERRGQRPHFLIDLSVPRNIDPVCADVDGVHVYDIDTMSQLANETRKNREKEIANCELMIDTWIHENRNDLIESLHHRP
ncbi:glutamyl-tRNA reductase [Akkermansia glycaniphila]|uniref:Glutamyl-tRNA reductase n=1 Tax=Akkermansia glycaniphila TaxID=1679444 RepID=A0A1H6LZH6_9BACT|nr:glutamyl-tRNA reductase [Akkermansia glycaniphila]SEH90543.1 hema: glutamyl-trna reductase [Akkermansia glycaniphila]